MPKLIAAILLAWAFVAPASAATYVIECTSPCVAPIDGTTQPAGTFLQTILWDGSTPYNPGAGLVVVQFTGQAIYAPTPPVLTLAQQATAAEANGIAITSTSTPALSAAYPTSGPIWTDLQNEAQFITTYGGFSTGTSSMAFVLPSGTTVTFTATTQLQSVVKADAMYLTTLKTIEATGVGTLPPATATVP